MSTVRARKSLTSQAVVCLQVGDADDDVGASQEAMDMSWPTGWRKRVTYVLLAPIVFPLWLTLPDTRSPRGKWAGMSRVGGARGVMSDRGVLLVSNREQTQEFNAICKTFIVRYNSN